MQVCYSKKSVGIFPMGIRVIPIPIHIHFHSFPSPSRSLISIPVGFPFLLEIPFAWSSLICTRHLAVSGAENFSLLYTCCINNGLYAEAEYAYCLQKKIIPLQMQPRYEPPERSWLGPLCRINLYYDYSDPRQWEKFMQELEELMGNDTKAPDEISKRSLPAAPADAGIWY